MVTTITRFTAAAALVAGLTVFGATQATAITWTGAVDNFWDGAGNWDLNRVPVQTDRVIIGSGTPLSALFGTSAHTNTNIDVSGGHHLGNNSYIGLRFPSLNRLDGGENRLFENARIDTARGSQTLLRNNGLLDIRDNAEFHNAVLTAPTGRQGIMTVGSTSSSPNITQLNISGTGTFNNAGEVRLLNATMNITGNGLFYNDKTVTLTGGSTNISGNGFFDNDGLVTLSGGSINLSDVGLMSTSANYTQGGGTVNVQSGGLFVNEVGAQTANLGGGTFRVHAGGRATNNADINNLGGMANNGGTVGPGNSPGTLTVDGDFAQGPGGTVAIEIDTTSSPSRAQQP